MANEDTQTTVANLDIQILSAERSETTTIKLDNPKQNLTREMVSAAMQPAFTNGWLLTSKGSVAMYLGDVTYNTSIKTKLGGEDFYVTPNQLNLTVESSKNFSGTINVSGATIQGYRFENASDSIEELQCNLSNNNLTATVSGHCSNLNLLPFSFNLILIIMGTEVTVPVTINKQS